MKVGVDISRLERNTRRSLIHVFHAFLRHGETLVITSTYEGNHSPHSLHYANQAYDIRKPSKNQKEILDEIIRDLGHDFDVVKERDHWHIEYDPK
ncbi:MAG: hypothetical protein JRC53_03920 [Deltaproteobacteria bacterium]|nr:hypothetical protein [Deltaproteobacteria bacterium]